VKYKVGDKVRVRSDLISGNQYGGLTFFDGNMSSHAGQLCTIKRVYSNTNGLIPTMTTTVVDASGKKATVTCDKADYSERQGVLEAIAQMACGGNFDKEYDKAVKKNKLIELHDRTCIYCGKVFDTVEELKAHEAWHVECKKARRKRYLLRKRAKEIAFEEQAQKMAREIIAEDNKK